MKRSVIVIGKKVSGATSRIVLGHLTSQLKEKLDCTRRLDKHFVIRQAFSPLRDSLI